MVGFFLFLHILMKKRHKQLLKKILKEEIGSTQSHESHSWVVEHPEEAWAKLPSDTHRERVIALHQAGRLHSDWHPHGWKPGTGPLFGRDFHGRTDDDYRQLHKTVFNNLLKVHDRETASVRAKDYTYGMRRRADAEGQVAHSNAMAEINNVRRETARRERERERATSDTRGAAAQESYRQNSEALFHAAMKGASDSAHYFRSGGEAERAEERRRGLENIDVRHPQLSDAAKKHLNTLTDISRRAIHSTVIGGLNAVRPAFREDAKQHWRRTFQTGMGLPPGINNEHHILHSLLTPEAVESTLKRHSETGGSAAQWTAPIGGRTEREPPYYPIGFHHGGALRVSLHPSTSTFHPSVAHLHLHSLTQEKEAQMREQGMRLDHHTGSSDGTFRPYDVIGTNIHASTFPIYNNDLSGGVSRSPFQRQNNSWWSTKHDSETDEHFRTRQAIGQGLRHIWSIPNISDSDRLHLHRHFESQLRHHYLGAVANPRMFDQHHRSVEDAQREQTRQEQGGQQSSRGSSSSSDRSTYRPLHVIGAEILDHQKLRNWPHTKHPQEVLGLKISREKIETMPSGHRRVVIEPFGLFADHEHMIKAVRNAHATLSDEHHPDKGGDPVRYKMIQDALAHYEREHALRTELKAASEAHQKARREVRPTWDHPERPHEILGIAPNATTAEIKKAHRSLMKKHHPDLGGDPALSKKIQDAHDHMMRAHGLTEWVIFTADWITKRYRK